MTENWLEIEDVLKFESLEPCKGKKAAFGWLRQPPKFKFSVSGKKNVRLFEVITKTSVLSDKNVPLEDSWEANFGSKSFTCQAMQGSSK